MNRQMGRGLMALPAAYAVTVAERLLQGRWEFTSVVTQQTGAVIAVH